MLDSLLTLGGLVAFIAMLVNVGKYFHVIKDGDADKVNASLQALAVAILYIVGQFHAVDLGWLNETAQQVANLGGSLLYLLPIFIRLSEMFHEKILAGRLPVVGFSYSEAKKK